MNKMSKTIGKTIFYAIFLVAMANCLQAEIIFIKENLYANGSYGVVEMNNNIITYIEYDINGVVNDYFAPDSVVIDKADIDTFKLALSFLIDKYDSIAINLPIDKGPSTTQKKNESDSMYYARLDKYMDKYRKDMDKYRKTKEYKEYERKNAKFDIRIGEPYIDELIISFNKNLNKDIDMHIRGRNYAGIWLPFEKDIIKKIIDNLIQ